MMNFRLVIAAWVVVLMTGVMTYTASAQDKDCKDELVKAAGRASFALFSRQRELDGRGAAMQNAITSWQRDVRAKYGEKYTLYEKADDASKDCSPSGIGVVGRRLIRCTIAGRPCGTQAPEDLEDIKEEPDRPGRRQIREAQRYLNSCDRRCNLEPDGLMGPETRDCILRFQRRYDLRRTGEADADTLKALRRNCGRE